jgi:mannose-6-phosphate isomerase-like protein (cupin superfamily)|tara:strand:- start:6945 stop:7421 length:477 start_codon:yes stop_codon:yes gene_type:complete
MSKYDYIDDTWVREALEEYKDKIDKNKSHRLDISSYRVEKPWGYELWLELNEHYAYKLIHMNAGYKSSLQWHEKKVETNYVIEGEAEVLLQNEDGEVESRVYKVGEGWCVPLRTKHRVIAKTDYTALECSTAHLNDCIRFEDDSDRGSGKIESEHEGN